MYEITEITFWLKYWPSKVVHSTKKVFTNVIKRHCHTRLEIIGQKLQVMTGTLNIYGLNVQMKIIYACTHNTPPLLRDFMLGCLC